MRRFPDVKSVAEASEEAVLAAWEGLGYYSRARNLHRAAKYIMETCGGRFPDSFELLQTLPGVGEYTAGAVASIAFNLPEPAVDTNVWRLLARLGDLAAPPDDPKSKTLIRETARALIPPESPRLFNQALIELGALICAKKPRCGQCPVAGHCAAQQRGTALERPLPKSKPPYQNLEMAAAVIRHQGAVLIRQRPPHGLWANLWEFPGGPIEPGESPPEAAMRHAREQTGQTVTLGHEIAVVRHGYSTRRVTLYGYFCEIAGQPSPLREGLWLRPEELAGRAFPAGHRKLMEHLGWKKTGH
jgi:A/G-specific adenine glycosylase